jgi:hypothetical protein
MCQIISKTTLWPNGGSPDAEKMWEESGAKSPSTVTGKKMLAALKGILKAKGKDEKLLDAFTIPGHFEVAPDLKMVLEAATASSSITKLSNVVPDGSA